MITSSHSAKAFTAGLPGFAISPPAITPQTSASNINASYNSAGIKSSKRNHLVQSLDTYLNHQLNKKTFNSSFLNSTSITSQEATEKFIELLQSMTDIALQKSNWMKVSESFFGGANSYYQSFTHASANNYLQEALLTLADSISQDSFTFSDLKHSADQVLASYGLPVDQDSAQNLIRGMSQSLANQLSNVGHLIDIKA